MRQLKITKQITNRTTKSVEKYLMDVSKETMVTADEEVVLAQRIKKGDQQALERLVRANLRFVISVAKQYQHLGIELPDLISYGNLGLIKAAQRFDETKGFKFISYAVWWIRQSILQAVAEDSRMVRIPQNRVGVLNRYKKSFSALEQKYEREPTTEELAENMELEPGKLQETLQISLAPVSLDQPMGEEDSGSIMEVIENKNSPKADSKLEASALTIELAPFLKSLSLMERNVVLAHYGIGEDRQRSLDELAERFSLSKERVRQIKDKGLRKLRGMTKDSPLRSFL